MRKLLLTTLLGLTGAPLAGCEQIQGGTVQEQATTAVLSVDGMTCESCAASIKEALAKVDGVKGTEVDVAGKKATVQYVAGKCSVEQIVKVVSDLGYTVKVDRKS
ncbi:MAG: heavy-metal-associated domain-containing protein [Myxococcota bacterium]